MHNKLWIADNAAAIVGGRNLGDEYFDAHTAVNFSDLDILAFGPAVRDISTSFDDYWNSYWALPIEAFIAAPPGPNELANFERELEKRQASFRDTDYARALRETRLGYLLRSGQLQLTPASATVLYDKPEKISEVRSDESPNPVFAAHVRPLIEAAQHGVILISPYFIPSDQGISMLGALVGRGVRVRVLTNSLASTDPAVVHAGYARLRPRLLAAGVELYEMRPDEQLAARSWRIGASSGASLHTKAILIGRRQVIVGSMNLDPRSRLYNTEIALLLESPQLGARLAVVFEQAVQPAHAFSVKFADTEPGQTKLVWITEENGAQVRYDREPAGLWRLFLSKLLGALTPEDLL